LARLALATTLADAAAAQPPGAPAAIAGRTDQPLPTELSASVGQAARTFPAPRAVDTTGFGAHLTRTMSLLATSTPEHRNRVKVLVYGQSISKQAWSRQVEDDLRARFPHADLVFENRSIGGFVSTRLLRTLEHDVVPFYPDLVIFHVYGPEPDYEAVIRAIRTRTTAEILIQNDFYNSSQKTAWHDRHSWTWLPEVAKRWGVELADVRRGWIDYLTDQKLESSALLIADGAHLNDQGNFLFGAITSRHLVHDPSRAPDPLGLVRTLPARWAGRRLVVPFEGNRVDVIASRAASAKDGWVRVAIDGLAPTRHPGVYAIGRPNADPNRDWPWAVGAVFRVDRGAPLLRESWTVRLTEVAPGAKSAAFDLVGSLTGFDGSGRTDQPFVSRSGRVLLWPDDWFLHEPATRNRVPIRPGFQITWTVEPQAQDSWSPPAWMDPTR
jgi:hypothetical protein